jgi:hypothetical protein
MYRNIENLKIKTVTEKADTKEDPKVFFKKLKGRLDRKERPSKFMPYVLLRSCAGDNGTRPLPAGAPPYWESPDIWTWAGEPGAAPEIPPNQGGTVSVGGTYTVYAHVWNLGRAPVAGALVEYYWFHPFLGIDSAHANLIGTERVDLAPRGFPGCHKLVKCRKPYIVQTLVNDDHPCLVARISAFGDPLNSAHQWDAWADRHVAQKNLTVLAMMSDVQRLLLSLDTTKPKNATVRLFQVGIEAAQSLTLVAPNLKLDPAVKTTLLAELSPEGKITIPPTPGIPRVMPHLVLNLANKPAVTPKIMKKPALATPSKPAQEKADISMLFNHGASLSTKSLRQMKVLPPPQKGQAQVLRIVASEADKPVGGYTIIITGA